MSAKGLDRFFEQMLGEPEGVGDPQILAARQELAAALLHLKGEIYESESAQSFLDRVATEKSSAPPELVAAMTAEVMRETRKAAVTDPRTWAVPRWGWAAGAVAASMLAIFAGTRLSQRYVAPTAGVVPNSTVAALQAPMRSDIASPVSPPPPPAPKLSERSDALIDGKAFNPVATPPPPAAKPKRDPAPVYTTPNPPLALTSHAVTVDDYPPASIRLQEQGSVIVRYTIGIDGAVSDCTVTISSNVPRLDDAACILVRKWTFKPATVIGGRPVAISIPAEIVFALK